MVGALYGRAELERPRDEASAVVGVDVEVHAAGSLVDRLHLEPRVTVGRQQRRELPVLASYRRQR